MKTIIEKIILNNFGKFIKGIERDKLSIDLFGGNFKMENISLNHEYFDSLDTPFRLAFSSIGILNIQAPLSKLSSVPVECILDNIYMIFEFKDRVSKQDKMLIEALTKKTMALQKYINELFNNYMQKVRDEKKQDGMFAKLGKKIIDNLQLKIVNLHVRFEEKNKQHHYGWGITLQEISFIPTDSEWKSTFIDRSTESQKNDRMFKMMNVKNFNLYWQSGSSKNSLLINGLQEDSEKKAIMSRMIKEQDNVIISITSEFKLVINSMDNLQKPIYQLEVGLQPIVFQLERVQISEMIDFAQKNIIQNEMIIRNLTQKKSKKKQYSVQKEAQLKQVFQDYVNSVLNKQVEKETGNDQMDTTQQVKSVLQIVQMDDLMVWCIDPVKVKVKKVRQIELKKKKRGWFGGENELTQQQTKQLEIFIEDTFDTEKQPTRPPQCLFFKIILTINGGKFVIIDRKNYQQNAEQSIEFRIGKIFSEIAKSQNQALLQINLQIEDINFDMVLPSAESGKKNRMNILANEQKFHTDHSFSEGKQVREKGPKSDKVEKFIKLEYEKKIITQGLKSQVITAINGNVERVIVTYKKLYLKKFKQFFTFKNVNEYVRNTTLEKFQNMTEKTEEQQSKQKVEVENILNINLSVLSPMFICPLNEEECWCLSLGTLQLKSSKEGEFKCYPMQIKSAYLKYYPKISWLYGEASTSINVSRIEQIEGMENSAVFSVIKDMSFEIQYKRSKTSSIADMKLPNFEVNFTEKQYNHLLSLRNIFKTEEDSKDMLESLKKQKLDIEAQMTYQAPVAKKNETLNTWRQHWGLLSGPYIYLYNTKKDLRFTEKIYIKNSRLTIRGTELQLLSQHEDCHFQCEDLEALGKWKDEIEAKMKNYKSIYQLMQYIQYQTESEAEGSKFTSPRKNTIHPNLKQFTSEIILRVDRICFSYENANRESLMNVQITALKVNKIDNSKDVTTIFTMESMTILEYLYKYQNQDYQSLLNTQMLQISIKKKKKSKVAIRTSEGMEKKEKDKQKEKEKDKRVVVRVNIPLLEINWKPDVLLVLLRLVNRHFSKEKEMSMNDTLDFTRANLFEEVRSDPKFNFLMKQYQQLGRGRTVKSTREDYTNKQKWVQELVRVDNTIGQLNINFIHRQTHIAMFRATGSGLKNEFVMAQNQKFVSGTVQSFEIFELTEYPQKNYSVKKTHSPYQILRKKQTEKQDNLPMISFRWSSYQPMALPNQERVNMFLYITVAPIQCVYFQQVVFRLIDYVLIQVILLLQQPEMITANEGLLQQLQKGNSQNQRPIKILFHEYEQIFKKVISPYFIDIYFYLQNPSIIMKSEKESSLYYSVDIEEGLVFYNQNKKDSKRFMKCQCQNVRDYIYEQDFIIQGKKVNFNVIEEEDQTRPSSDRFSIQNSGKKLVHDGKQTITNLFGPVEFEVVLNKLIMEDEINTLYPQINTYDRSFRTTSKCTGIQIPNLSRNHYLSLNKLVNFNFTFDDEQDELFIHNFKITKILSPKPITFQLEMDYLQINGNLLKDVPLFAMRMEKFRMMYNRNKDLNSNFQIWMGTTSMIAFEGQFEEKEIRIRNMQNYQQRTLAEKTNRNQQQQESQMMVDIDRLKKMKSQPKQRRLSNDLNQKFNTVYKQHEIMKIHSDQSHSMDILIDMRTTGEKVINLNITQLEVFVQTGLLQVIFQWCLTEDWIFPVLSSYLNEITFFTTVHKLSAVLKRDNSIPINHRKAYSVVSQIQSILDKKLSFQQDSTPREFKLLGVLCYKFHRKRCMAPQIMTQKLLKGELKSKDIEEMPETSYMTVILNTQAFHCLSGSPNKRKVLEKFTFNLMEKRFLKVADHTTYALKPVAKRNMNIDRALLKISFTDIILMKSLLQQMQKERQYITVVNKLLGKEAMDGDKAKQTEMSSLQNLDIQIQTTSLYIINNCRQRFIPVMRINMNAINITKCNTYKKEMMEGDLDVALSYFNVAIFRWEPVIERTGFSFHRLVYYEDRKTIVSIECLRPLLVNISKEMFIASKQTLAEWSKSVANNQDSRSNQPIEFISHYIIRNETGYAIEVYNMQRIKKHQISHEEQIDYKYELDDYDDEKVEDIVIGIRILHPTVKLKMITNVTINPQKEFTVVPVSIAGNSLGPQASINFIPQIKYSKQYLIVRSNKRILDYTVNPTKTIHLPFDHEEMVILPDFKIKVSLFREMDDKNGLYRFLGKQGTLKIMKKFLVYNYTPIPLSICGNIVPPNDYVGISQRLTIQGKKESDSIFKVELNEKLKEYYIYCQAYVVDYYGLGFNFGQDYNYKVYSHQVKLQEHKVHIYVLPHPQARFQIRMSRDSNHVSYKPSIGKTILEIQNKESLCQFSVYTYLTPIENCPLKEFKKVIQITPEYVLSNLTKDQIKVSQIESVTSLTLKSFERMPFFWEDRKRPKEIKIAAYDGEQFWGYSGAMQIEQSTQSLILRKGSDPTKYRVLTCQVERTNTVTFLHFIQTAPKYILSNKVKGCKMVMYQTVIFETDIEFSSKDLVFVVEPGIQKPFGYELPTKSHQVTVQIELDQTNSKFAGLYCEPVVLQDLELNLFEKTVYLYRRKSSIQVSTNVQETKSKPKSAGKLKLILQFQGNVKKLKLIEEEEPIDPEPKLELIAKVHHLGVSFIGNDKGIRKELIHLIVQKIEFQMSQSDITTDQVLEIGSIKLENQLQLNVQFPILLESAKSRVGYCMSFVLSRDSKNSNLIHQISLAIGEFIITITSEEIEILQNNIMDIMAIKISSDEQSTQVIRDYELFRPQLPVAESSLYFISAQISPLTSIVTFKHVNDWGGKLLKTFSSINECPIAVNGKKISHFSCKNITEFMNHVMKHYQEGLSQNILPLIGNLSILGSPMVLVQKIGSGFKDLVELPYQGFQIGAKEGGIGIAKGARSLLKNTFQGTFNSLESLTGSIGNGLSSLVDDDQYNRKRQRIRNQRSDNVVDGLYNGAKSIANGFQKGVTGVISKPLQGAERDGIGGFFLGGFKGLTGLIIKPISGIIDATSKTAQGIKNTANYLTPSDKLALLRTHNPRVFYHVCRQFRQYDVELAFCSKVLETEDMQKYSNLSWSGCYLLKAQKPKSRPILLLAYEYMVFYDLYKMRIMRSYHPEDIFKAVLEGGSRVVVHIKDRKHNYKEGTLTIQMDGSARQLHSQLKIIIKSYRPTYSFDYQIKA